MNCEKYSTTILLAGNIHTEMKVTWTYENHFVKITEGMDSKASCQQVMVFKSLYHTNC